MKNIILKFAKHIELAVLLIPLLSLFPCKSFAQTLTVKGRITASSTPVRYASVTFVNNSDANMKFSAVTDSDGNYSIDIITAIRQHNQVPSKFKLEQNYPNPFKTSTNIPYKLGTQSDVKVTIYDILGRVVRRFSVGSQMAGTHSVLWNGRNNYGEKVAAGIYFYTLQAGGKTSVKKMVYGVGGSNVYSAPVQILSSETSAPGQKAELSLQSVAYSVTVANTDSTLPAVVSQQFSNVTVQNDTTLNFSVYDQVQAEVYSDSTQQIIRGFGGANIVGWNPGLNYGDMTDAELQTAFGNGPGQLGFTILRLRIPPDSTQFDIEVPSAKYAESLGAKVIASPWTPPASMKTNNSTVGGYLKTTEYAAYAAHLKSFADYMASHGAPLYAVSLQNEPDANVSYESCYWTATQFMNFCKNNAASIGVRIMMPESESFRHSFSDSTLNNPAAAANVAIIAGHLYGGGLEPYPLAKSKGKDLWMTEYLINDTTWVGALGTGKQINDCVVAGMNAYVWWWIVRFYSEISDGQGDVPLGDVTKRGYVMSQFSKFVRPGYYKIENSAAQRGVYFTAYKDSSSSKTVIVALNMSSSPLYQTFSVENGSMNSFIPYTTSATENVEQGNNITVTGGKFTAKLEPSSITTFVSN